MFKKKVEFHCYSESVGPCAEPWCSSRCRSWPCTLVMLWAHRRARSHEEWMWQSFRLSVLSFSANTLSTAASGLFVDFMLQDQISIFPPE